MKKKKHLTHNSKPLSILPAALTFACLLLLSYCSRLTYDVTPDDQNVYNSITIKVNVKAKNSRKRQNFKILLKYDASGDKMHFLTPLNHVFGQLFIMEKEVLLINTKNKRYWRGDFGTLISEIWGLDFTYPQFKQLITEEKIPPSKQDEKEPDFTMQNNKTDGTLERITITYKGLRIKMKLYGRKQGMGKIDFTPKLHNMTEADIETALREK
ncbi:MAG: DUF4292 domain-containing protein [bacterium]|nr:DUF4292 domain-containing protein [bacterium]